MKTIQFVLETFDHVAAHPWESTASALADLTEEEANWQAPDYVGSQRVPGLPLEGTVLWHIAHLEYCTRFYGEKLRLRTSDDDPTVALPETLAFPDLIDLLWKARAELREQIALLADDDLKSPTYNGDSVGQFLCAVFRHESWHGGQIAMLRRLYRMS